MKLKYIIIPLFTFCFGFGFSFFYIQNNVLNNIEKENTLITKPINTTKESIESTNKILPKNEEIILQLKKDNISLLSNEFIEILYKTMDIKTIKEKWKYINYYMFKKIDKNLQVFLLESYIRDINLFDWYNFSIKECIKYWNDNFNDIFNKKNKKYLLYKNMNKSPFFNDNSIINERLFSLFLKIHLVYPKDFKDTKNINFLNNISCNTWHIELDEKCKSFKNYIKTNVWKKEKLLDYNSKEYNPNIAYIDYINGNVTKDIFIKKICSYERN